MERSSTDLPEPEPPTMPNTSPRSHRHVEAVVHDLRAEAVHQAADFDDAVVGHQMSSCQNSDGEHRIGEDHQEDRLHHGDGSEAAELARGVAHLQAAVGAGQRDQQPEDRRLDDAHPERRRRDGVLHALEIQRQRHVEQPLAQQRAAGEPDAVGDHREQRHARSPGR